MASSGIESSFQPHAKFMELKEKGADEYQAQLAVIVYLDLCESQEWTDIELHYSVEQHRVYILGRWNSNATQTIVIPMNVSQEITFFLVGQFLRLEKENNTSLILALCESDSTVVYYSLAKGLQSISSVPRKGSANYKTETMDLGLGS